MRLIFDFYKDLDPMEMIGKIKEPFFKRVQIRALKETINEKDPITIISIGIVDRNNIRAEFEEIEIEPTVDPETILKAVIDFSEENIDSIMALIKLR